MIRNLSEDQKAAIKELGFGGILSLRCGELKRGLCARLIERFDTVSLTLNVYGEAIQLSAMDVECVMGLRNEGLEVETTGPSERIHVICNSLFNGVKDIPLRQVNERLCALKVASDEFRIYFVLFLIGHLLYPTMRTSVSSRYLHSVVDVPNIGKRNWAKFVFDGMVEGVRKYQTHEQKNVSGCLLVLMVRHQFIFLVFLCCACFTILLLNYVFYFFGKEDSISGAGHT